MSSTLRKEWLPVDNRLDMICLAEEYTVLTKGICDNKLSHKRNKVRPSKLATMTPVTNRMAKASTRPNPGIEKPKTVSGRHSTGNNSNNRSIRSSKNFNTRKVMPNGTQTSKPAIR